MGLKMSKTKGKLLRKDRRGLSPVISTSHDLCVRDITMSEMNGENQIIMDDGVRLFFQRVGSGPKVVIPNGIYLLEDFKNLADERTLIVYDLRNRGLSDQAEDGDIHLDRRGGLGLRGRGRLAGSLRAKRSQVGSSP